MATKWVIIIEQDAVAAEELSTIVREIETELEPVVFDQLQTFQEWLKEKIATKKTEPSAGGTIPLILVSKEILNTEFSGLLKRLREFLIRRGLATAESPTSFVMTGFDIHPGLIKNGPYSVLSNLLCKPLDRPFASQAILNALSPGKSFSLRYFYSQTSEVKVESLKDVQLVRLSEYGFTTLSERPISPGTITKFHHQLFMAGARTGVYGRCRQAIEDKHEPGKFLCHFTFYAITPEQLLSVRKYLKKQDRTRFQPSFPYYVALEAGKKGSSLTALSKLSLGKLPQLSNQVWNSLKSMSTKPEVQNVVVIGNVEAEARTLGEMITRNFQNTKVSYFAGYLDFLLEIDPALSNSASGKHTPFPSAGSFKFKYAKAERIFLSVEPAILESVQVLGVKASELLKSSGHFESLFAPADRPRLSKFYSGTAAEPGQFEIQTLEGHRFYIQIESAPQDESDYATLIMRELSVEERQRFLAARKKIAGPIHALILNQTALGLSFRERVDGIVAAFERNPTVTAGAPPFMIGIVDNPRALIDENQGLHSKMSAILPSRYDKPLLLQLCALDENGLDSAQIKSEMQYCEIPETLKASTDVTSDELSEAGIVFRYYRDIPEGEFRSFHLPLEAVGKDEEEPELIELLGRCHLSTKIDDKSGYRVHFSFFGMTDIYLKHIRTWMKKHYVLAKKEEAA